MLMRSSIVLLSMGQVPLFTVYVWVYVLCPMHMTYVCMSMYVCVCVCMGAYKCVYHVIGM